VAVIMANKRKHMANENENIDNATASSNYKREFQRQLNAAFIQKARIGDEETMCLMLANGAKVGSRSQGVGSWSQGVDSWSQGVDSWSQGVDSWSQGVDSWSQGVDSWSQGVDSWSQVDAKDAQGSTVLMIVAALHGKEGAVRMLLEKGAKKDATDFRGRTALMSATCSHKEEAVRLLLEAGAAVDAAATDGRTALMLALDGDSEGTLRMLLEKGGLNL
jgi:hypothetical protein